MSAREFSLQIDSCPYKFSTAGYSGTVTSTDADWNTQSTNLVGWLAYPNISWTEKVEPIEGKLSVSGINLTIHDLKVTTGPASGYPVMSWLNRPLDSQSGTVLSGTIDDNDTTIVVGDGSVLGSFPNVIYLDQEAVYCDSISTNTITVNASGRGYYNSKARSHGVLNPDAPPVVRPNFPGMIRRRCILWRIDGLIATALYRGVIVLPQMSETTAAWSVAIDHCSRVVSDSRVVSAYATPSLIGYGDIRLGVQFNGNIAVFSDSTVPTTISPDKDALCAELEHKLRSAIDSHGTVTDATVGVHVTDGGIRAEGLVNANPGALVFRTVEGDSVGVTNDNKYATLELPLGGAYRTLNGTTADPQRIYLSDVVGLPATGDWGPTTTTDNGVTTEVSTFLRGKLTDDIWLQLAPSVTSTSLDNGMVYVDASVSTVSRKPGVSLQLYRPIPLILTPGSLILIKDSVGLEVGLQIKSGHWLYGLQHGIIDNPTARYTQSIDSRDWSISTTALDVLSVTQGLGNTQPKTWRISGEIHAADLIKQCLTYNGCGLVLRGSKLCVAPFGPPNASATITEISAGNYANKYLPRYYQGLGGIANIARLKGDTLNLTVDAPDSIMDYGPSREVEVNLDGISEDVRSAISSPVTAGLTLGSRILNLWSRPRDFVRIKLPESYRDSLSLLGYATITADWNLPDGLGGRGNSDVTLQIVGLTHDLTKPGGSIEVEGIVWRRSNKGYAPMARVESIAGAELTLDRNFWTAGTTTNDFQGNLGATGDGGTSFFRPGSAVRLIQIDTTSPPTPYADSVLSNDTGARHVTLQSSVPTSPTDWPALATSGYVCLVFDLYDQSFGTLSDHPAQEDYAFVGDETDYEIMDTSPVDYWGT